MALTTSRWQLQCREALWGGLARDQLLPDRKIATIVARCYSLLIFNQC